MRINPFAYAPYCKMRKTRNSLRYATVLKDLQKECSQLYVDSL